uniref:EF-hand domain-containing protein n=1 Tax=Triticum urartu TaxID=4572 RepID=A0A8R7PC49_TRIUA
LASIASRLCSCKGLELANAAGHGDQGGTFAAGDDGGGVQGVAEAVRRADRDNSGFIDDAEVENLVAFAQKDLGMRISAW